MHRIIPLVVLILFLVGCNAHRTVIVVDETQQSQTSHDKISKGDIQASHNHVLNAQKFYVKGKYKQAAQHLSKAIEKNPTNWEAYYYMGMIEQKQNYWHRSIGSFNKALSYCPDNNQTKATLHFSLGVSWEKSEYWDKAYEQYAAARLLDPKNVKADRNAKLMKEKIHHAKKNKKDKERTY
jgi:tetratricopeptide (TPR) repeat protein